ncbi:hypothetical protein QJS10_CPB04g00687 [Acorus calamus]|uniref:Uncharacterized protein n=1 Tax=Acorus calamus TaxID=4465 RepID=A0AAV9EX85_ACOCL|nr:hypothetical protein QJS10_CPB04g00687 [Acorus calamus]
MKCIFKNVHQSEVEDIFEELGLGRTMSNVTGNVPGISVVFHHLLRELSADIVSLYALNTIQLFEHYIDISIDQHLNYRLLGLKLSESQPPVDSSKSIINRVLQVISHYETLNEYLVTVEAYLDLILQYQMDNYLAIILDGISTQVFEKRVTEDDSDILQSVLVKLINHFNDIEDVFALSHFTEILDVLNGNSRDVINTHILIKATRSGYIHDPSILERLFDVAQSLHGSIDFLSLDVDCQQRARLITRFVQMVDFGSEKEHHLTFLVECRAAFGKLNLLKETLVHSCNNIAMKAIKDVKKFPGFVKACITFNEVTIPSVSTGVRRIYLYLETAEVALLGGLISHADGLINSAVSCLQDSEWTEGLLDVDGVLSSTCKLCSMIISLPGNPEGLDYFPKSILYSVDSQSWITLGLRMKMLCAIVSLSAALSQKEFPYLVNNRWVERKDLLFLGEPSSYNKLGSFCHLVLQNLIDSVEQESQKVERGKLALQACNCLMMAYEASHEVASICSRLMGIAKSCLHAGDTYMLSTMNVFDKSMSKLISDVTHVS